MSKAVIHIDAWKSAPIPITGKPKKNWRVNVGTRSGGEYRVVLESVSHEICRGCLIDTPPEHKRDWKKGDQVLFHVDHILGSDSWL